VSIDACALQSFSSSFCAPSSGPLDLALALAPVCPPLPLCALMVQLMERRAQVSCTGQPERDDDVMMQAMFRMV